MSQQKEDLRQLLLRMKKKNLMPIARNFNIRGRTTMTRTKLIEAIIVEVLGN